MNAFDEIPHDMIGKFDIVHVRAFGVVITRSNPESLLRNLIKMLSEFTLILKVNIIQIFMYLEEANSEPGGYPQWDELDRATVEAHAPNKYPEKGSCVEILGLWKTFTFQVSGPLLDLGVDLLNVT